MDGLRGGPPAAGCPHKGPATGFTIPSPATCLKFSDRMDFRMWTSLRAMAPSLRAMGLCTLISTLTVSACEGSHGGGAAASPKTPPATSGPKSAKRGIAYELADPLDIAALSPGV